jgi:hypothetical protein
MTATVTPSTTTAPSTSSLRSALATKPVWLAGLAATVTGAVATTLIAAVAKAADVPLAVASSTDDAAEVIPTSGVTTLVLGIGVVGVLMALAFNRWATRPARTFVAVTVVLTAVSFITPTAAFAHNATTATRLVLELMHVVAAAIIIPPIAYRLANR